MDSLSLLNQNKLPTLGASAPENTSNVGNITSHKNYNPAVEVDGVQFLENIKDQFDQAYTQPTDPNSKLTYFDAWSSIMVMADNVFTTGKLHTEMKNYQNNVLAAKHGAKMTEKDIEKLDKKMNQFIAQAKKQNIGYVNVHWANIAGIGKIYTDYKASKQYDKESTIHPMGAVVIVRAFFSDNLKDINGNSMAPDGKGTSDLFKKLINGTPEQQHKFQNIQEVLKNLDSDTAYKGVSYSSQSSAVAYDDVEISELTSLYSGKDAFLNIDHIQGDLPSKPKHETKVDASNMLVDFYYAGFLNVPTYNQHP